uniref:Uncharacterized protein n=1 Tax=Nelumbo nucifera TaxID=4432 RepID=A0A822Y519_NELNU|nr:TPA_asm: hypothetical protein HUJ06_027887 [Nelumbo nucifera]
MLARNFSHATFYGPKQFIAPENGTTRFAHSVHALQFPKVDTAAKPLSVMWDQSSVVALNDHGTC